MTWNIPRDSSGRTGNLPEFIKEINLEAESSKDRIHLIE